jgi:hypothetical protein
LIYSYIIKSLNYFILQVARESVKEQIFDVSHQGLVKTHLQALLSSEIVSISDMCHDDVTKDTSAEEEGIVSLFHMQFQKNLQSFETVRCNVGDCVEVLWDYSPGVCSEGGTGVVIALNEGTSLHIFELKI